MTTSGSTPASPRTKSQWYDWYVATVISAAGALAYLDRQIMGLLTEPIKNSLHLTDVQMSFLQSFAFVPFFAVMSIPLGFLADRWPRRTVMGIGIFLWSLATAACGLAGSFVQLFGGRVGVGVGEASLMPAAQSLLPDYFEPARLPRAFALFQAGVNFGGGMAYAGGGLILWLTVGWVPILPYFGALEPWQIVFIAFAVPGPIVALLMLTVREPERKQNAALRIADEDKAGFQHLLNSRKWLLIGLLGGAATMGFMTHGLAAWTPSLFIRTFGWSTAKVGIIYGCMGTIAGASGSLMGGQMAQVFGRWKVKSAPVVVLIGAWALVTPLTIAYGLVGNAYVAIALAFGFSFFIGASAAMLPTVLQLATPHVHRGRMGAIYVFAVTVIGATLGPMIIAFVTDYVFHDPKRLQDSIAVVASVAGPIAIILGFVCYRQFSRLTLQPGS